MDLNCIQGLDIYLLDQLMKSRLTKEDLILDAGCGKGRNSIPLLTAGYNVNGFDPDSATITSLQKLNSEFAQNFEVASIDSFENKGEGYNFIICNAVLHFSSNHREFESSFQKLVSLLQKKGILFIRMTSDIGLSDKLVNGIEGVYNLPDGSSRYLITRQKIDDLIEKYGLELMDPVKTVNVDDQRCMTTLVLRLK